MDLGGMQGDAGGCRGMHPTAPPDTNGSEGFSKPVENSVLSGGLGWFFWLKSHTPVFKAEFDEKLKIAGVIDGGVFKSADLEGGSIAPFGSLLPPKSAEGREEAEPSAARSA